MSDRDLVVAFKGGDVRAYASIYREYRPMAESICHRILGNPEDAQEAAQETMLRVFQGLPRFNGRYLLRAWVARIATNVCLDLLRARGRRPDTSAGSEPIVKDETPVPLRARMDDPLEVIVRLDESDRVRGMLGSMPSHHRAALEMREFDGLSHEEIGRSLGMTPPQVKALIHRAKKNFKRSWTGTEGGAFGVALPLLGLPFRWLRRVFTVGPDTTPVTQTQATQVLVAAQSPAAVSATYIFGERFTAAAAAVVVAGGIGVGAVAIPHRHSPPPSKPAPRVIMQAVQPPPVTGVVPLPSRAAAASPVADPAATPQEREPSASPRTVRPAPHQASATPAPSDSASPAPASSDPGDSTTPPAPAYTLGFVTSSPSSDQCGCDGSSHLLSTDNSGRSQQTIYYSQRALGAASDSQGERSWSADVNYYGAFNNSSGTIELDVTLSSSAGGHWRYRGSGSMFKREAHGDGTSAFFFTADLNLTDGSMTPTPMGTSGQVMVTLSLWKDQETIYAAAFRQL